MAAASLVPATAAEFQLLGDRARPDDETYWAGVADNFYAVSRQVIGLEHGNFGTLAKPVLQAYQRNITRVNEQGSYYSRRSLSGDAERIRAKAAKLLGVGVDEIVFTRGATESLQALIGGYNRLRPGDAVLHADLDYDSMQTAMRWLKNRRGVESIAVAVPEPATHQGLIDFYAAALTAHPTVRLMLLTHVSHRTGLIMPVAEIVSMARARGVDVIVDSAHAWAHVDFDLPALGADFVGLTCHKWIGAPLGLGLAYIRRERVDQIDRFMGSEDYPEETDIRDRIHSGTSNFAALLALEDALDFHIALGPVAKAKRLRWLRDCWVEPLRGYGRLQMLTPADPRLGGGISSFRLAGVTSVTDNLRLARTLLEQFNLFAVHRTGVAAGACVRVTPNVFTPVQDIERLKAALKLLAV